MRLAALSLWQSADSHLSDEAVAAFADGMLLGRVRERAAAHVAQCQECFDAVAAQREATCTLRSLPAPVLPSGLLDRLRAVPDTTVLNLDSAAD